MRGKSIPLSIPRRVMCDLMAFAKDVPTVPVQRRMNVSSVVAARARLASGPGYCAIFTKAFAITAQRFSELRRAYISLPRPRLYEHPISIASVAIERQYEGENCVFWCHLRQPDQQSLHNLQALLRQAKDEPLQNSAFCRRVLKLGRLPRPIRRLAWWLGLNFSGKKRAHYFGTFGISVYSGLGAESLHPISPLSTTMNYGPIDKDGFVSVRFVYDHRVMDGATVARALACMEDVLNHEIVAELAQERKVLAA